MKIEVKNVYKKFKSEEVLNSNTYLSREKGPASAGPSLIVSVRSP